MEAQRCFSPNCEKEVEYRCCTCTSPQLYFCDLHASDHTSMIDTSHSIERTFKLSTKKLILEQLQKVMCDQYQLKLDVAHSFFEHCSNINESLNAYMSEDQSYAEKLNYVYDKISEAKEVSEHEQDPILKLLYLPPEKAIENIEIMSNRLEFYNYSLELKDLIVSLYQSFHEKVLKIKQRMKNNLIKPFELYKKSENCYIVLEPNKFSINLPEIWNNGKEELINSERSAEIENKTIKSEFSVQSESESMNKIASMDQLIIDWRDPKKSLYCVEIKGVHYEITEGIIRETGEKVAVRSICSDFKQPVLNFKNEIQIYEKLSKKNLDYILKYYGHFNAKKRKRLNTKNNLHIVTELCETTLLDEFLKLHNQNLHYENHTLAKNFYALLDLFKNLSEQQVLFCNIAPQNIFVVGEQKFKLGDFYIAKAADIDEEPNNSAIFIDFERKSNYMAPELNLLYKTKWMHYGNLNEKRQLSTEKSDVFSLGLVFLMMINLRSINGLNEYERRHTLDEIIENLKLGWAKRLLKEMLKNRCEERPSFEEALIILKNDSEFISCRNWMN